MLATLLTGAILTATARRVAERDCLGEFSMCDSGECSMGPCGGCEPGQYLCPSDQTTCVDSAADYTKCPGIKGTHFDWTMDDEARLDYLVANATLEEQVAQMTNTAPAITRLGIPAYNWLNDDQHGVARTSANATVFPNGCGLGATWSKQTLYQVGEALGTEARGLHNGFVHEIDGHDASEGCNGCGITLYSPNLNLVRDPRWGRAQETFGEDPWHMSRLVVSFVRGAQNRSGATPPRVGDRLLTGMCCKHFAAYDVEAGRDTFNASVNARNLWESYLPAFEACISEAKATHVMCSYNKVNGVPTCGEKGLLTDVLRTQWGFKGFVVSDYDAWAFMQIMSHYVPTLEDAAVVGLDAGLDQEGGGQLCINTLPGAVKKGRVAADQVAQSFRRLMRIRLRLGMFDPPTMVRPNYVKNSTAQSDPHMSLARTAARESICLYKNERAALPISLDNDQLGKKPSRIAVVGPSATKPGLLMGNYAESGEKGNWGSSVLDEIRAVAKAAGVEVVYAAGCETIRCNTTSGFAEAAEVVKTADVVIVALGLEFNSFCEDPFPNNACEREGTDRGAVELPGNQSALVQSLRKAMPTGSPLVALLVHGGSLAFAGAESSMDAIVDAWYPGIEGAAAIADVLFGRYNPAGRTAVTWYKSTTDLPVNTGEMDMYAGNGLTYRYFKGDVMYPFGYGLSYTTFSYSDLKIDSLTVGPCDSFKVTVTVRNTGSMDGDEVVQVYVKQPEATVPVPRVRLAAFARVNIKAGEAVTVDLNVAPNTHTVVLGGDSFQDIYNASRNIVVEKGTLQVSVGGGQPGYYSGSLSTTVAVTSSKAIRNCA